MTPEEHREIARQGGLAAHRSAKRHTFTPETAKEAGRKGAAKLRARLGEGYHAHLAQIGRKGGQVVSQDVQHMREMGIKGSNAKHAKSGG